jgi:isoamylase
MAFSGELFQRDADGYPLHDSAFLLVLNRSDDDVDITLPPTPYGDSYRRLLDTADERPGTAPLAVREGTKVAVSGCSVTLFRVEE